MQSQLELSRREAVALGLGEALEAGDAILGHAADEREDAGQDADLEALDEERHVGNVDAQEEGAVMSSGERLEMPIHDLAASEVGVEEVHDGERRFPARSEPAEV